MDGYKVLDLSRYSQRAFGPNTVRPFGWRQRLACGLTSVAV